MRSNLIDWDFRLLLEASTLNDVVDDGFATDQDEQLGLFDQKKALLATRYEDFKACMDFFDHRDLCFRRRGINRNWGTSDRMLKIIEQHLGRQISHGALLLALDLRGMNLERIDNRKDVFMGISDRTSL